MKADEVFLSLDYKKRSASSSVQEQIPDYQDKWVIAAEDLPLTWNNECLLQHILVLLLLYWLKCPTQTHHVYASESFEFNKAPQAKQFTTWFLHFTESYLEHATTATIKYMSHPLCSIYNSNILISSWKRNVYQRVKFMINVELICSGLKLYTQYF